MPTLNLPVIERIARAMLSALNGVKQVAGYANDFTVQRWNLLGNVPEAGEIANGKVFAVLAQPAPTPLPEDNYFKHWIQPFWIYLHVCPDEDNAEDFDSRINSARADCERVLVNEDNRTWGGLAIDTQVDAPQQFPVGRAYGIRVVVNVQYRHVFYDPCLSEIDQ